MLGDRKETQQSPDLSGVRSEPVQSDILQKETVDHRSKEIVVGTHIDVKPDNENIL